MITIQEALQGVNAYPIPMRTLVEVALGRGLVLADEATAESVNGKAYKLAIADLLMWLSIAPDVSQGGQSYSFTDEQRKQLRREAAALYSELGEDEKVANMVTYGYKGDRL